MLQRPPLQLFFVRHGESEANIDKSLYQTKADHAIRLTERGESQAEEAGKFLASYLLEQQLENLEAFGAIRVWHSPYYRARQTARGVLYHLGQTFGTDPTRLSYMEEPFLHEQKAGLYDGMEDAAYAVQYPKESEDYEKHKAYNGVSYARTPLGDSRIDVVLRSKPLFGTILRDYYERDIRKVVVISHGVTARAMTMGWMRYTPEWLDAEKNPGNCWIRHLCGNQQAGYVDQGYIFGENAPLHAPRSTQKQLENPEAIFMLKPLRPNSIVPPGVILVDPFAHPRDPK
jgi:broad specificity phosphatase PhoE